MVPDLGNWSFVMVLDPVGKKGTGLGSNRNSTFYRKL